MVANLKNKYVTIDKIDAVKHIMYGVVYEPDVQDSQGDAMSAEEIEKMAYGYMLLDDLKATIDTNHDRQSNGSYPVESFLARKGDPDFPEGSWVLAVKVTNPEIWARIEKGDLNGFSFEAMAKKQSKLVEYDITNEVIGETLDTRDHTHFFFVHVNDAGKVTHGITSVDDGHHHTISKGTATDEADGHSHRYTL